MTNNSSPSRFTMNTNTRTAALALLSALSIGSLCLIDLDHFDNNALFTSTSSPKSSSELLLLESSHARRLLQAEDEAASVSASRLIQSADTSTPPDLRSSSSTKPIMSTFFTPVPGGCCGMTEEGHTKLVSAWRAAWEMYGWETRVLTESDARKHDRFEEMTRKLEEANVNGYNQRCFWRWLAMSSLGEDGNGGWMSDYDFFPLRLTSIIGQELATTPGFKSWSVHVPTLIHADPSSWNLMTNKMIDTIAPNLDIEFMSDMYMLEYLYNHHTEKELGISAWERLTYPGFPMNRDTNTHEINIHCGAAMTRLGAHLSHSDTHKAVDSGVFPRVPNTNLKDLHDCMNKRSEAANIMVQQFRERCFK